MRQLAVTLLATGLLSAATLPAPAQTAHGTMREAPPPGAAPRVEPPAAVVGTTPDSAAAPPSRTGPGDGTTGTRLPAADNPVGQTRAGQGGGG